MPLPSYVSAGAIASNVNDVSISWGAGHQADDVGLLLVQTPTASVVATPAGWAHVTTSPVDSGSAGSRQLALFWKRATSSAEAAVIITDVGTHQGGQILVFRGCKTSGNPFNICAGSTAGTSTSLSVAGVTTTAVNCLVVVLASHNVDNQSGVDFFTSWANSNLTNLTERSDTSFNTDSGGGFGVITGELATAGASGTTTATLAASARKCFYAIALEGTTSDNAPDTPTGSNGTITSTTIQSVLSAFNDIDGNAHLNTDWQLDVAAGDFSAPVQQSLADSTNKTSFTFGAGTPLSVGTAYKWRARMRDNGGGSNTVSGYCTAVSATTLAAGNISFAVPAAEMVFDGGSVLDVFAKRDVRSKARIGIGMSG